MLYAWPSAGSDEDVIRATCGKTHFYASCVAEIHSYPLFEFVDHSPPGLALIMIRVAGLYATDTIKRIKQLQAASKGESPAYIDNLATCNNLYTTIVVTDYHSAENSFMNKNFKLAADNMRTAGAEAMNCEKGFSRAGKFPLTNMNKKMRKLSTIASEILRSL
uniref:Pectinesterase inhibitor domain-containing protein n=1 Tax=Kalanchoe fedtschenkoi TaxID=63787 RepID=A0A7N0UCQ1_KALFE